MRILFSAPSQFWHVHIGNLNAARTKSLAFNINIGTHKSPSVSWNTAIFHRNSARLLFWHMICLKVLLVWSELKCGHTLISQETVPGERPGDLHFSWKSTPIPNTRRGQQQLFTSQDPIHRTISTITEASNIFSRTEH